MGNLSTRALATLPAAVRTQGVDSLAASCLPNAIVVDKRLGGGIRPVAAWLGRFEAVPPEQFRRVGLREAAGETQLIVAARERNPDTGEVQVVHLALSFSLEGDRVAQIGVVDADFAIDCSAVREFLDAVNLLEGDRLVEVFAPDAIVNDDLLEYADRCAIETWIDQSVVGERLAICPIMVDDRGDRVKLRASLEGAFDKRGLPDPLFVTLYFSIRDARITQLIILRNLCDL